MMKNSIYSIWTRWLAMSVLCVVFALPACSKKKMTDREKKREQLRNQAEAKRKELAIVGGTYRGILNQNQFDQDITLILEVKDVPDTSAGEVDPVLIPALSGSMRLTYGDSETGEYYGFGVKKADFDAKRNKVDIVVGNEKFKDVVLSLSKSGNHLSGNWNAPDASSSGKVELDKATSVKLQIWNKEIKGRYKGFAERKADGLYQSAILSLTSSQDQPGSFSLSASLSLVFGEDTNSERMTIDLGEVDHNPFNAQLGLKSQDSDVYLIGTLLNGEFDGNWYSKNLGLMGRTQLNKSEVSDPFTDGELIEPIKGIYYGNLIDQNPNTNFPSRVMLNVVTFTDLEKPEALGVTGNIRLYIGPFSSSQYEELHFEHVEYNPLNQRLAVKASGRLAELNIEGTFFQGKFEGVVFAETAGSIGPISVERE